MANKKAARREAKRLFQLCVQDGALDADRLRKATHAVVERGSRSRLPVLGHLLRLVRLYETQHTAAVESATPLPPELRSKFETTLARRYGPGLSTTFAERPSLIGGVRIQVGSDLYDGSVAARLAALEKSF